MPTVACCRCRFFFKQDVRKKLRGVHFNEAMRAFHSGLRCVLILVDIAFLVAACSSFAMLFLLGCLAVDRF